MSIYTLRTLRKTFQFSLLYTGCIRQKYRTCSTATKSAELVSHLKARIKVSGPITIAKYMQEVLTNPVAGYYMNRDVFGTQGDFITSPEISQVFGELLGVWCVSEWLDAGSPEKIQLVELGPGRGTLADDMLRVFSQFPAIKDAISLHMVEVSPTLSQKQAEKLAGNNEIMNIDDNEEHCYKKCTSKYGFDVSWYKQLQDVPSGLSCYIAHEFFDALPIHQFKKTERGWREVMVDYEENNGETKFKYVLAPGTTAASTMIRAKTNDTRDMLEISPESGVIVQEIAKRVQQFGGFALLADYGHNGEKGDTFRGFHKHALHDPLIEPGTADLTADVDFSYLKSCIEDITNELYVYGPITQQTFLEYMGIGLRLKVLLQKAKDNKAMKDLVSGCNMLINPDQMGERFKFMAVTQKKDRPAGFKPPTAS